MPKQRTPQFQPISRLALLAHHIDGMVEAAADQYHTLLEAKPKPYVLDNYTVGRVITVVTTQQNDLALYDEQLRRWQAGTLTQGQRCEVNRLVAQMAKLRETVTAILALAKELSEGTIEKHLAKTDASSGWRPCYGVFAPSRNVKDAIEG